jgi:hypothetical protein
MKASYGLLALSGAAILSVSAIVFSQTRPPGPVARPPVGPVVTKPPVLQLPKIVLKHTSPFDTFTDLNGQMVGAGQNFVAIVGEDGAVQKSFPTQIARPAIAPHGLNGILIGDLTNKTLFVLDVKTSKVGRFLALNDVKDASREVPHGSLLRQGSLAAVASDGQNAFVAVEAGFSSAIFKIDPKSKQILARGWATAGDPAAMSFNNGGLFVLVDQGKQVRRFTEKLERSRQNIDLAVPASKGLMIRGDEIRVLTPTKTEIVRQPIDKSLVTRDSIIQNIDRPILTRFPKLDIKFPPLNVIKRYAILITGDLAENFAGECFWNDTVWMYKTLLANGYKPEDIFVLYGDGADFASLNAAYQHPSTVTDLAATPGNVITLLDGLKNGNAALGIPKVDDNDTLFLWTFDHGGQSGGESTLCLRGGCMLASTFSEKFNLIPHASRAVFMQQCFSGGFINPLKSAKTFISTACRADEVARPADTENEMVGGRSYSHGEFNYHITTALNRLKTTPPGGAVNADGNADTWISSLEMHNWNVGHESRPETPQSNDMGGIGSTFKFKK